MSGTPKAASSSSSKRSSKKKLDDNPAIHEITAAARIYRFPIIRQPTGLRLLPEPESGEIAVINVRGERLAKLRLAGCRLVSGIKWSDELDGTSETRTRRSEILAQLRYYMWRAGFRYLEVFAATKEEINWLKWEPGAALVGMAKIPSHI